MLKLAKFWAPWCGPCKQLNPIIEKIEQEYSSKGLVVEKINVDEEQEMTGKYQIMSIPCLVFIKDNQEVDRLVGLVSEARIKEVVEKHL